MTDDVNGDKPARPRVLVPQEHGGALLRGSNWGNKGSKGPPTSELRARMRTDVGHNYQVAVDILQDTKASNADRLRALDLLLKYSVGTKIDLGADEESPLINLNIEALREELIARHRRLVPGD